jgi:YVTN family beta-propeller protein
MVVLVVLALALAVVGCSLRRDGEAAGRRPAGPPATKATAGVTSTSGATPRQPARPAGLPGMPPQLDPGDVYASTRPGRLARAVRRFPARVYVPNSGGDTVDVIDARTFKRIRRFGVGRQPQHVTPSWDLRTLWVGNNRGNSLTAIYHAEVYAIDTGSGRLLARIPVGAGPHGLCVYPQPGRYSLGHTGVFR